MEDLTDERVHDFLLDPVRPLAPVNSHIYILKKELLRWHPDNFSDTLDLVSDGHRKSIQKGAEIVIKLILDLLEAYA